VEYQRIEGEVQPELVVQWIAGAWHLATELYKLEPGELVRGSESLSIYYVTASRYVQKPDSTEKVQEALFRLAVNLLLGTLVISVDASAESGTHPTIDANLLLDLARAFKAALAQLERRKSRDTSTPADQVHELRRLMSGIQIIRPRGTRRQRREETVSSTRSNTRPEEDVSPTKKTDEATRQKIARQEKLRQILLARKPGEPLPTLAALRAELNVASDTTIRSDLDAIGLNRDGTPRPSI